MPIIVIGAPRSGTKMLREILKLHPQVVGELYEQEKIWSFGNKDKASKSLSVEDANIEVKRYIRNHFDKLSLKNPGKIIVDKNVTNCLRIGFIHEIFPNAPIIHIIRDGRDAVCSARIRWKQPTDLKYILKNKILKEKKFPIKEIPFFLKRVIRWKIQKLTNKKKHVRWWGPKFDDMENLNKNFTLIELCGIQWARCVESALDGLQQLDPSLYYSVKYEDLVTNTEECMSKICNFLSLPFDKALLNEFKTYANASSIGRWEKDLTSIDLALLYRHIGKTLEKTGYSTANKQVE